MDDKVLEQVYRILALLFGRLGTWGTLAVIVLLPTLLFLRRYVQEKRADRYVDRLIQEKERAIQTLAHQNREYRKLFLVKLAGFSLEEAESLVTRNVNLATPAETVEFLEGRNAPRTLAERR